MREAQQSRVTGETSVNVGLNLDKYSPPQLDTGVPFFEHMLHQVAIHAGVSLNIKAKGDIEVDPHHLVEDTGIVMGKALQQAIGDKKGIERYGHAYAPLDEALSRTVIDISGRPGLFWKAQFSTQRVGAFDVQLVREFFQGFVNHAAITLHMETLYGNNTHHQIESLFKSFARALAMAVRIKSSNYVPSSKNTL